MHVIRTDPETVGRSLSSLGSSPAGAPGVGSPCGYRPSPGKWSAPAAPEVEPQGHQCDGCGAETPGRAPAAPDSEPRGHPGDGRGVEILGRAQAASDARPPCSPVDRGGAETYRRAQAAPGSGPQPQPAADGRGVET